MWPSMVLILIYMYLIDVYQLAIDTSTGVDRKKTTYCCLEKLPDALMNYIICRVYQLCAGIPSVVIHTY